VALSSPSGEHFLAIDAVFADDVAKEDASSRADSAVCVRDNIAEPSLKRFVSIGS